MPTSYRFWLPRQWKLQIQWKSRKRLQWTYEYVSFQAASSEQWCATAVVRPPKLIEGTDPDKRPGRVRDCVTIPTCEEELLPVFCEDDEVNECGCYLCTREDSCETIVYEPPTLCGGRKVKRQAILASSTNSGTVTVNGVVKKLTKGHCSGYKAQTDVEVFEDITQLVPNEDEEVMVQEPSGVCNDRDVQASVFDEEIEMRLMWIRR